MKRLEAIASKIIPCKVFADIGCDHGIIGLYVVKNNLAERVCECDISEDSLGKARTLIGDDAEFCPAYPRRNRNRSGGYCRNGRRAYNQNFGKLPE